MYRKPPPRNSEPNLVFTDTTFGFAVSIEKLNGLYENYRRMNDIINEAE